jgi:transmembrane sensor
MSTGDESNDAELEAAAWVVRLDEPGVTTAERAAFSDWLAADPAHKRAYDALSGTWEHLSVLRGPPPRPSRAKRVVWAGALGLALAAGLALFVVLAPRADHSAPVDYASQRDASQHIQLPDGSTIELAPASMIEVAFNDERRLVQLTAGAALFDVSADPVRPFIVATRFGEVRVRGTEFAVHVNAERARATVLHGEVEGARAHRLFVAFDDSLVLARANEEIVLDREGARLQPASAIEVERRLAWRTGMLALDGETLAEACAEVARVSGVRFSFAEARLADLHLSGFVPASDAEAFTTIVVNGLGLEARRLGPNHVEFRTPSQN